MTSLVAGFMGTVKEEQTAASFGRAAVIRLLLRRFASKVDQGFGNYALGLGQAKSFCITTKIDLDPQKAILTSAYAQ